MGIQLKKWRKTRRTRPKNVLLAISPFSIFLIGFGICLWSFYVVSLIAHVECRNAAIWLDGWFTFSSPLQWTGVIIVLAAYVWIFRIITLQKINIIETLFQGVLILALAIGLVTIKVTVLPYGDPSHRQVSKLANLYFPTAPRLVEEDEPVNLFPTDPTEWRYDYPPPPDVEFEEDPRFSREYNKTTFQIFRSKASPLPSEMEALRQCYMESDRAIKQFIKDRETLKEYWEGFYSWYALNREKYEE